MTTLYVHPGVGNDTTGDGSIGNPYATRAKARSMLSNGEHWVLVMSGSNEIITAPLQGRNGTSTSARFTFGTYGGFEPAWMTSDGSVTDLMYLLSGSQYITIEDWGFDCDNATARGLTLQTDTSPVTDVQIRRIHTKGATSQGVTLASKDTANHLISNVSIRDSILEDCEGHGFLAYGEIDGVTVANNRVGNNSTAKAEHGISAYAMRTTLVSQAWTLVSGTTYKRTIAPVGKTVYAVTSNTGYARPAENVATPTAPGAGFWGQSGGEIYLDIGSDPSTATIAYSTTRCRNLLIEDNEVYGTDSTDAVEGTGIQLDDFCQDSIVRRNFVHDNVGRGITVNRGSGNQVYSNIVAHNGRNAISFFYAPNGVCQKNTTLDNNQLGFDPTGGISLHADSKNCNVSSNIVRETLANIGIYADGTSTGTTASKNNVSGQSGIALSGLSDAGLVTVNPLLRGDFSPQAAEVLTSGAVLGGVDFYGVTYPSTPSIGAVQSRAYGAPLPWVVAGSAFQRGSFAGRVQVSGRGFTSQFTEYMPWGFGGRRHGSFAGRIPFGGTPRTGGPFTRYTPFGFGGRRAGPYTGRVTANPIASGAGALGFSGTGVAKLIVGDAGGPASDLGFITITGSGLAVVQIGGRIANGTGVISFTGAGEATAVGTGIVGASGTGLIGFTGAGAAFGPLPAGSGAGSITITGSGSAARVYPGVGEFTLQDIVVAVFQHEVVPGVTFESLIRRIGATTVATNRRLPDGTIEFDDVGNPGTPSVRSTTDGKGIRTNIDLVP